MDFVAPNHFLVLEKATGIVRRVTDGVLSPTLALDVAVNSESERGLLGIAVNRETPRKVFLYYTEAAGGDGGTALGNRVYRSIPGTRARGSSRAHSWSSTSRSPRDPITTAVCSFSGLRATERAPATAPTSTS
jgi:glucose/arabinose dehydrogenase